MYDFTSPSYDYVDCIFSWRDKTDCDCGVLTRMRHMKVLNRYKSGRCEMPDVMSLKLEIFLTAVTHLLSHDDFIQQYDPEIHLIAGSKKAGTKKQIHYLCLDFGAKILEFPCPPYNVSFETNLKNHANSLQFALFEVAKCANRYGGGKVVPRLAWIMQGVGKDGPYCYTFHPRQQGGGFLELALFGGVSLKIDIN
ncbi:hypothetical protein PFICI_01753 [Pestalotiopsis fici W106-1]|uniref:Uncharacterized protein n=1 Tax=Pestalotiopsis fici (strain W106-1 / CGMCC3.15140) TaxID=1229662 RepID=W3XPN7_PESFW|nr:uncharacterized protein PFICI_01753 [Pestalotiopsis fici W106-1]ETS87925.1 hypothetical protein PFICI_01753 [Pestalotiopsis fici W106-1]